MTLNGISGTNGINAQAGQLGINQGTDSYTQNIKRQIANLQKQLQELSSNEEMSMEEKLKKRQQMNQEINNLNNQLRQHQMEQRKEKQEAKSSSADNALGSSEMQKDTAGDAAGISSAGMQALIAADSSMQQVQVQSKVKTHMEGQAKVLQAEIRQDGALGGNTEAKEEKLAKLEDRINKLTAGQMSALSDLDKNLDEAVKEEQEAKTEASKADESRKAGFPTDYASVDIRL